MLFPCICFPGRQALENVYLARQIVQEMRKLDKS